MGECLASWALEEELSAQRRPQANVAPLKSRQAKLSKDGLGQMLEVFLDSEVSDKVGGLRQYSEIVFLVGET